MVLPFWYRLTQVVLAIKRLCVCVCVCVTAFLLAEQLLELLIPALEIFQEEAVQLGLEVNWQKTMVQALGSVKDEPSTLCICGHDVQRVQSFV